jgi:type IV pilus assembly protein PilY1
MSASTMNATLIDSSVMTSKERRTRTWRACVLTLVAMALNVQTLAVAQTPNDHLLDISPYPFAKYTTTSVRANLMFIMDDSGSMDWDYMPDGSVPRAGYCYGYHPINRLAYNPAITYKPPVQADGTPYPNASFTAAWIDGFNTSLGADNLSNPNNRRDGQGPGKIKGKNQNGDLVDSENYYTIRSGSGGTGNPATQCSDDKDDGFQGRWTVITTLPAAEQQNYANWYSYYRTRMNLMKTAVGLAMSQVDRTRFRVGFSAISSNSLTDDPQFMPMTDMNAESMNKFFDKLYKTDPGSGTPLRPALEKIGKYYAGRTLTGGTLPAGTADPVQYSCQRNYALLTTDGYWNSFNEGNLRANYVPTRLDGSTQIGDQDGGSTVPRPMRDDGRQVKGSWVTGATTGQSNLLADIAAYFYNTDLRTPVLGNCAGANAQDLCTNDVIPSGKDDARHQHMATYSLGLGVAGSLTYRADYDSPSVPGSFADIVAGSRAWPKVTEGGTSTADDLWHAAVNGRGRFYSASDPTQLTKGLTEALDSISAIAGVAAAAATSSLQPVEGDNFFFIGEYTTVLWEGSLRAHKIDPVSGVVSATPIWESKDRLKAQVATGTSSRKIYFRTPGNSTPTPFTPGNLTSAGLAPMFTNMCPTVGAGKLSQCATANPAQVANLNSLNNMVEYIRGSANNESKAGVTADDGVFRTRPNTPLGDVVNSSPVYVKQPPFRYTENNYQAFKADKKTRQGVVYLAANDGMLHAINADNGDELWAYVPTEVMPRMHRRADFNYATTHEYSVDGSPVVGDVYDAAGLYGGGWRTVLVGGLGGGGRGYYAMDVTDPTNPKILWEINDSTEPTLGLTYGNPVITKDKAGNWIVAFTSGYTSSNTGGFGGNGHVYIRNVLSGAAMRTISTEVTSGVPAGTALAPNNLGKLQAWVDSETDNTAARFYSSDMLGNIWRIDFDNNLGRGYKAEAIAKLQGPTGATQPITTSVNLTVVGTNKTPVITVATGRYLGLSDITDLRVQSIYAFKDELANVNLGNLRARGDIIQKTWVVSNSGSRVVRRFSNESIDWTTKVGWYADLTLTPGERVNVDMAQASGYLGASTNIPKPTACNPGGTSWLYIIGVKDGSVQDSTNIDALAAGVNMVVLPSGVRFMQVDVNGAVHLSASLQPKIVSGSLKRNSWREVILGR